MSIWGHEGVSQDQVNVKFDNTNDDRGVGAGLNRFNIKFLV